MLILAPSWAEKKQSTWMVFTSYLHPCCIRTASSNSDHKFGFFFTFLNFAQVRKYQMSTNQENHLIFLLNTSIIDAGIQVSLVKPLLLGFISMYSPCFGVQVIGNHRILPHWDTANIASPRPGELFLLPAIIFSKGH